MATLQVRLQDLATRIATQCKTLKTLINGNAADLSGLATTAKTNLVASINELHGLIAAIDPGAVIDDVATAGGDVTWSIDRIKTAIADGDADVEEAIVGAGGLAALTTTAKGNLVAAINEVKGAVDAIDPAEIIDDAATTGTGLTWSIDKISTELADMAAAVKAEILGGATGAYDTLQELRDLLAASEDAITAFTGALGNRVRVDTAAQGLTTEQKANARTNIAAYGPVELGDPDTNLVTTFETGLT